MLEAPAVAAAPDAVEVPGTGRPMGSDLLNERGSIWPERAFPITLPVGSYRYTVSGPKPTSIAMRTSSDRLRVFIFSITRARWISTVRGLMPSS